MFGRIDVIVEEKKDVPVIQQVCLVSAEPNPFVFVVSGGKAHRREVVTGIKEDDMVEIVSGLQTGETVVRVGQAKLHDGSSVEIKGGEAR
jgi:membrane fusion protein (multidrug efflux system)